MQLQKIILENYGIYQNENTFDFTTMKDKPIILCGGKNGGGKTTLFESVMLGLYGQNFSDKKLGKKEYDKILENKIHKSTTNNQAKNTSITIEFQYYHFNRDQKHKESKDVQQYSVTRSWKNINGEIIEKLSIKNNDELLDVDYWDAFIRELIPRGIARLFFFDGEKIATIAKHDDEDTEVKNSIESLLGLDIIRQLKSDLEINLGRTSQNQEDVRELENKVEKLKKEVEVLDLEKTAYVIQLRKKNEEKDDVHKKIEEYEHEISKLGGNYADQRTELQTNQIVLKDRLTAVEKEMRILCDDALPFSLIPKQIEQLEHTIKSDQAILKNQFEKQILNENLESLRNKLNSDKFWDQFEITSKAKNGVVSKIEEFFEEKISGSPKKQENIIGLSQKDSDKILDEFDRIREDLPKRMESLSKEFNQITEKLQKIKTSLANAPADSIFEPILEKIRIEYDKISTIKSEARRFEDKIQIKKGEISIKRIEGRKEVASKHDAYDVDTNIELTKKVQNALDEYATKLKDKKIHLLENYILESLKIILHKEDFIHKVSIDKETFEITLYDKNKDVIRRDELSEGEKQLFATSILWSLAKTSGRSLPFIIDTPLARLDVDHRDNLVEEFFPAASHQVIILSTDTEITKSYYEKLLPYITRSYSMEYDSEMRCSKIADHYFEFKEEETIAV